MIRNRSSGCRAGRRWRWGAKLPYRGLIGAACLLGIGSLTLAQTAPAGPSARGLARPEIPSMLDSDLPAVVRAAAQVIRPSVVTIETFGDIGFADPTAPGNTPGNAPGGGRGPRSPQPMLGLAEPGAGPCTGLIISPDGYIITSTYNFLRRPQVITITLADGTQYVAHLLGRDDTRGVCLLKINVPAGRELAVPTLVDPADLKVGQWAIALGVGYGTATPAVSVRIISGLKRIFGRAVQTDARISPANYGGPLIDIEGRVIGICVPLSPQAGPAPPGMLAGAAGVGWYDSGVGFAVPLAGADAARWFDKLKAGQDLRPGRMGVLVSPSAAEPGEMPGAGPATRPASAHPVPAGLIIRQVQPGSAAAKAGLQPGDIMTAVAGRPAASLAELKTVLAHYVAGDTIPLTVRRGGKNLSLSITLEPAE